MDILWVANLFFIFFSAHIAHKRFKNGDPKMGWFNIVASAINFSAVLIHFNA